MHVELVDLELEDDDEDDDEDDEDDEEDVLWSSLFNTTRHCNPGIRQLQTPKKIYVCM